MDIGAQPPEGYLAHPCGLSQFQQSGFSWELSLAVGSKKGTPTVQEIPGVLQFQSKIAPISLHEHRTFLSIHKKFKSAT